MLYLVPTPIGNLRDITLRALDVLKEADVIACEDTRHTHKLLAHYEIKKPVVSYHDHSDEAKTHELVARLEKGETIALVSDAGMPLISDPGFPLVRDAIRKGIRVEALPGPFAGVTALAASGLPAETFYFAGFLPQKSAARKRKLADLIERPETLMFYESPYRVDKVLAEMAEIFGDREAVVARELTKKFEEIVRGPLAELVPRFSEKTNKGEFVILVSGKDRKKVLL